MRHVHLCLLWIAVPFCIFFWAILVVGGWVGQERDSPQVSASNCICFTNCRSGNPYFPTLTKYVLTSLSVQYREVLYEDKWDRGWTSGMNLSAMLVNLMFCPHTNNCSRSGRESWLFGNFIPIPCRFGRAPKLSTTFKSDDASQEQWYSAFAKSMCVRLIPTSQRIVNFFRDLFVCHLGLRNQK